MRLRERERMLWMDGESFKLNEAQNIFFLLKRCVLGFSFARSLKAPKNCFKSNIGQMALVV